MRRRRRRRRSERMVRWMVVEGKELQMRISERVRHLTAKTTR